MQMFFRLQTQWRATYGHYYGLDYDVVLKLLDLYEVEDKKDMLEQLQVVEFGVLEALGEKK